MSKFNREIPYNDLSLLPPKVDIETEETKISREVENVANYGEDNQPLKIISHRKKSNSTDTSQQLYPTGAPHHCWLGTTA
ncbi:hypothetical protein [Arachidicoccus soli]|nr:hypothetical protein [Arachidicoccus soli]